MNEADLYDIIRAPVITEKATMASEHNQVIFKVADSATKPQIREAVEKGREMGLRVNAGHGLNYRNVMSVAAIDTIEELNIGHAIVARAVLVGMERAVSEMKDLMLLAAS